MPLKSGKSRATIGENIAELERAGHKPGQAEAIAFKKARGEDSEFNESDHPRDPDGKFGAGGASSAHHEAGEELEREENSRSFVSNRSPLGQARAHHTQAGEYLATAANAGGPNATSYMMSAHHESMAEHHQSFARHFESIGAPERRDEHNAKAEMHTGQARLHRADLLRRKTLDDFARDHYAFDFQSVRRKDVDGRLHVALTPISKGNVCPYYGREIPNAAALGLEPDRIYQLLRDPVELAKAAPTFNNLPLLDVHIITSANDPHNDRVVGSTGTDAVFDPPYLMNSLVVWDGAAIAGIESSEQRELSSSYRYDADMTPGVFEGQAYDGRMINIVGNHVALVEKGRAGADVVVSDSQPPELQNMSTKRRTAVAVRAALSTHLRPLLAVDGAIPQVSALMRAFTTPELLAKDAKLMLPKIDEKKLVKDLRFAYDEAEADKDDDDDDDDRAQDEETEEERKERDAKEAKDKKAKDKKAKDKKAKDEPPSGNDPSAQKEMAGDAEQEEERKAATDAAILKATNAATRKAVADSQAIRQAERDVQPLVGEVAAMDSAEAVYRYALDSMGVANAHIHASALSHLVKVEKDRKAERERADAGTTKRVAMDSDATASFASRFNVKPESMPGSF